MSVDPLKPIKSVEAGDNVQYETKAALTTWRGWGAVVSLLSTIGTVLVATGHLTEKQLEDLMTNTPILLTAGGAIAGIIMSAVGGFRAKRPLSLTGGKTTEPKQV